MIQVRTAERGRERAGTGGEKKKQVQWSTSLVDTHSAVHNSLEIIQSRKKEKGLVTVNASVTQKETNRQKKIYTHTKK